MARKIVPLQTTAQATGEDATGDLKAASPPAWMSDTEARLYDELVSTTRKHAARGVPVSYSVIADVAEAMERAHREGRSALRELAAGLDAVQEASRRHRAEVVAHRSRVFDDGGVAVTCVIGTIVALLALGATLAGLANEKVGWLYFAAFLAAIAGALFTPTVFALRNR